MGRWFHSENISSHCKSPFKPSDISLCKGCKAITLSSLVSDDEGLSGMIATVGSAAGVVISAN